MKRYYRNRFILGAMVSFFILLVMAVVGIWLFSYQQMERETNAFLQAMQQISDEGQPSSQAAPPPMFGYTPDPRRYPSGFYDISLSADGTIRSIQRHGIIEEAEISVQQYVQQAVREQSASGKIRSYKYAIAYHDDGSARLIMLDISIQLQALYSILKSALLVGAILMALLFLILLPVSARVAEAFVRNSEKQKQFITDAGHDLKTPVAIIRSSLDVLELQGKSKWSENIRSQTVRLERLIEQLLMMARLDETSEKIRLGPVDLAALLREEKQHFLPVTERRKIRWRESLPESLKIRGDEKTVRQMLSLLLDNAARYTDDSGEITLSGIAEKKRAVLRMSNTVEKLPGLSPEQLSERFVRGNTARTQKSGGAGIGLSAVKRIAEMNQAKMEISYPGDHEFRISVFFRAD